MIIKHKQQYFQKEITSIRTPPDSHNYCKNHLHKNPLYFRVYADFEADNEKGDCKSDCNKTTNSNRQIPVCNGYEIVSELEKFLKSGYCKSPLGYGNDDWFVE